MYISGLQMLRDVWEGEVGPQRQGRAGQGSNFGSPQRSV